MAKIALKKNIVPGSVLILLAGKRKGARVVFLKQLSSGLLLVTGPLKLNGVAVRRVAQPYVIVTSSKVELPAAVTEAVKTVDDKFFHDLKVKRTKETKFITAEAKKAAKKDPKRVALQKAVDTPLIAAIKKVSTLH